MNSPTDAVGRTDLLRLAVRCIDLTTLEGDDTPDRVRALCAHARRPSATHADIGPTAAVCVYPALVPVAVTELAGTDIGVASVAAGFPAGLTPLAARLLEIEAAVADGADEIDVVMNRSAFLTGDLAKVADELASMRAACPDQSLKVILETGELGSADAIAAATDLAIAAGAQFVKTSTGKTSPAATPEAVTAIADRLAAHHRATGDRVGLKVSGGVRTADDAIAYLELVRSILGGAWLDPERFRFGASKLLGALVDAIEAAPPQAPAV